MENRLSPRLPIERPALSVNVLAADLLRLDRELARIELAGAPLIHIDVMDGHVTPSLSVGPLFVGAIQTPLLTDVHVLVKQPSTVLRQLVAISADVVTVQLETTDRPLDTLREIDDIAARTPPGEPAARGIAIGPQVAPDEIVPLLEELDLVVVLGVELVSLKPRPVGETAQRLQRVRDIVAGSNALVAVDGGVTIANVAELTSAHPDIIVAGSTLFSGVFETQVAELQQRALTGHHP